MNPIRFALLATLIVVLLSTTRYTPITSGQGENMDYLPFSRNLLRPFKLNRTEVAEDLRSGRSVKVGAIEIQEEKAAGIENESEPVSIHRLVFTGRNLRGKQWQVKAHASYFYDALYEGDLDRNGASDLILAMHTGGNGLAPSTRLIFLTVDRRGDPNIFEATGYYETHPQGIWDVADLDGDRRAELVHMVFDDGYWITNVYRLRESRWNRVTDRFAGLQFPLYTRFTHQPNHKPVRPARGRNPVAPNLLKPGNR
jgi:hypothetical protein